MILLELFKAIKEKGGAPFIVGGFVRDKILDFPNKDYDIEVFNITEYDFENILKRFGTFKKVGNFSIYLIRRNIEIYLNIEKKDLNSLELGENLVSTCFFCFVQQSIRCINRFFLRNMH